MGARHDTGTLSGDTRSMSVLAVTTFLALLALGAGFAVLVTLTFMVVDRIGLVPGVMDGLRGAIRPIALWLAFAVAATSMLGSLYLSEVAGFVPCALCWYQRIAMYPLAVILGVAAVRGDPGVARYAAPVAVIGALISAWHIGVQRLPGLPSGSCSLEAPCNLIYVERFGFVTIPTMALFGFLAILTLLLVYARSRNDPESAVEPAP
jgi:disulfide bond formation protein DsbB